MKPKVRERIPANLYKPVRLLCVAVYLLIATGAMVCHGQQKQKVETPVSRPTEANLTSVLVQPNEDYRIGPGDVIEIQIDRAPEISGTFRVTAAGTIVVPYINRITAQHRTPEELSAAIADGLRGRYLKDPKVTITVKQINSHSFFIQGAVHRPGVYQIEGRPSLLKVITVAGGLSENHGSTAFVIREIKPPQAEATPPNASSPAVQTPNAESTDEDAKYEMVKLNISGLLKGNFSQNMSLEPGDIINIPVTDIFFVSGEVREPGSYSLKDGTTLRQAISLAQGTTFKAASERGIIFREEAASGKRQEIKVNIAAVMRGSQNDIPIMANDIIIVPNSRSKTIGAALLTAFGVSSPRVLYRF